MKDKLLKKIVKENYNNNLEKVLSKKDFPEDVKNALLSMFYKIETGFDDYSTVKRETFDKKEYIEKLINIIEKDCDKIEFIKKDEEKEESEEPKEQKKEGKSKEGNQNKGKGQIVCEPNDIKILSALAKMRRKK